MMIQRPDQRVAVFIDTQNMYHSAKHVFNSKVSFSALVEAVVGSRMISRAIAYVAKSKGGDESAFFEALLASGIELKIKDVQEFASGAKKADWDVGMAVDAISISSKVDVIVLATGDGDFVPLVEYLKAHGVICEVAAFAESTNARLREVADAFTDLSSEPDRFLIGYRGRRKTEKEEPEKTNRKKGTGRREAPPEDDSSHRIRITH
jgi:uncharacterized LabA/DUF88 family protein